MKPIATLFGDVKMPPTDPEYVEGGPGSRVPSVAGLDVDAARQRLKDSGFQVAEQPASVNSSARYGEVVGTSPNGQTIPGAVITIQTSNGIPPAPPPPPEGFGARASGAGRFSSDRDPGSSADHHPDPGATAALARLPVCDAPHARPAAVGWPACVPP